MQEVAEQKYLLPYRPPPNWDIVVEGKHYDPDIYARAELIRRCGAMSHHQRYEESERCEACDNAVRDACLDARHTEFRDWYEHMIKTRATVYDRRTLPNRVDGGDIFSILLWENEGRVPVDEQTSYAYVGGNMPALLGATERNTMRQLAALVPYDGRVVSGMEPKHARGVSGGDAAAAVARPDTLFVCRECGARGLPWPEIHAHWRERHPHESFWARWAGHLGERPRVQLWEDGREVVRAILDEAGLKKGLGRMDRLVSTGRLYCACGDPELPLLGELDWAKFVQHV